MIYWLIELFGSLCDCDWSVLNIIDSYERQLYELRRELDGDLDHTKQSTESTSHAACTPNVKTLIRVSRPPDLCWYALSLSFSACSQCFDTVGWATGRALSLLKPALIIFQKHLFRDLAQPGVTQVKRPAKQVCTASYVGCQYDTAHICCWAPAPAALHACRLQLVCSAGIVFSTCPPICALHIYMHASVHAYVRRRHPQPACCRLLAVTICYMHILYPNSSYAVFSQVCFCKFLPHDAMYPWY